MKKLRDSTNGKLAERVIWSDELIAELEKTQKLCNKLLTLYPVDENWPVNDIFDSSYTANTGFFYQMVDGVRHYINFFCRRRSDSDN